MKTTLFIALLVITVPFTASSEDLFTIFSRDTVTKAAIMGCFAHPIYEERDVGEYISSTEGDIEVNIATITFIEGNFIQGWITLSKPLDGLDSFRKRNIVSGLRITLERLLWINDFVYFASWAADTEGQIGSSEVWLNRYWQFTVSVYESSVQIFVTHNSFFYDSIRELYDALSEP